MHNFFKHSNFEANPFLNGGNKRTAQINELLSKTDLGFKEADFSQYLPPSKSLVMLIKSIGYCRKSFLSVKKNYSVVRYLKQFEDFIKNENPSFFIWESTSAYNLLLSEVLKSHEIPFFALPHNIESLVEGSKSTLSSLNAPYWLFEELKYLSLSNNVFTISKEEQWLLSLNEINSQYLPYYPTESLKNELLKVREKKEKFNIDTKKEISILLLGTFHNKPTFDGYIELLDQLKKYKKITVNVCGFGSELLEGRFPEHNIKIKGTLSIEELNKTIITSTFGIIHQKPSSGALTRISELLIAGLPLFVNNHAARSAPVNKGLYIYNTIPELLDLISNFEKIFPSIPERPKEEGTFINYVRSFINDGFISK